MAILNGKTVFSQILFKIVDNPTMKLKTESGIILAGGKKHMSDETGNWEDTHLMVGFGIVTAVGPDVKSVKIGDGIFYAKASIRPVPLGEEVWNITEQMLMAYVDCNDPSFEAAFTEYNSVRKEIEISTAVSLHEETKNRIKHKDHFNDQADVERLKKFEQSLQPKEGDQKIIFV